MAKILAEEDLYQAVAQVKAMAQVRWKAGLF